MPETGYIYIAAALAIAVGITVSLRALPFWAKATLKRSALLADIGTWMPLGAVTILAVYGLSSIPLAGPTRGIPQLVGVAVTVAVHLWRRNMLLSIVTGTAACVLLQNLVF